MKNGFRLVIVLISLCLGPASTATNEGNVPWQRNLTADTFAVAKKEQRFVLLNLEAVWCHWCHVMDEKTYADESVAKTIEQHYIPVRIDHDARPDLAQRYRNYGWPATIIFGPDGTEIVKRAGFIAPESFTRLLNAIVDDPSPEAAAKLFEPKTFSESPFLNASVRNTLKEKRVNNYDAERGGLKSTQKFLDRDSVEYNLLLASQEDSEANQRARQTLDAALSLIDPVWGGAYQYSTFSRWDNPHFEKIMLTQAGYLRIYALAYAQYQDPKYLEGANDIRRYLNAFLRSPQGAYFTSQDADLIPGQKSKEYFDLDDQARRALGIPRIDKNVYAQENGWVIEGLATLYEATGDPEVLNEAVTAANWIVGNRSLGEGGFAHGDNDVAGPYLGDNLAMGRAFLQLYRATADRAWLDKAAAAASFVERNFRQPEAGFVTAIAKTGPVKPVPHLDENISATRFFNLLHHYTGNEDYKALAEQGMRYIATPAIATRRVDESGILLADLELANDPAHYTIIGSKQDATAKDLYRVGQQQIGWYKRIEWWDTAEGPLPNPDVKYPVLGKTSGFVCTNGRCSLPVFDVITYEKLIVRLSQIES